jgi:ribonucleoside-diphosphate reductase beta chain
MKGVGTIIEWSIRDETLHVEGMTQIFRELIRENPEVWTDSLKGEIYQACRDMVELEDKFIDLAFEMGDTKGLAKEDVKKYIRHIADRRLLQLGLKPNYMVKENPLEWIDWVLNSVTHSNFFESRSTEYAKGALTGSWGDVWA